MLLFLWLKSINGGKKLHLQQKTDRALKSHFLLSLVFSQRASSFGGFDLTNRSVTAVSPENDNTVCGTKCDLNQSQLYCL